MQITSACHIRHKKIILNNSVVYSEDYGKLADFLESAYNHFKIDYPKFYKMDRLSKLGFLAAELLLEKGNIKSYQPDQINIVLSNATSSLDTDIRYAESSKTVSSPALFVYTLPNIVVGEICIRHKIKGENAFFISEQFDAELMESYVSSVMMKDGGSACEQLPNSCVAGWVEVLHEHHDVFLYLVENSKPGLEHSAEQLRRLYHTELWNN